MNDFVRKLPLLLSHKSSLVVKLFRAYSAMSVEARVNSNEVGHYKNVKKSAINLLCFLSPSQQS